MYVSERMSDFMLESNLCSKVFMCGPMFVCVILLLYFVLVVNN